VSRHDSGGSPPKNENRPGQGSALAFIKEQDLLAADSRPQFFQSRLDCLLYVMRHTTLHTGEINAILSRAGLPWGEWL